MTEEAFVDGANAYYPTKLRRSRRKTSSERQCMMQVTFSTSLVNSHTVFILSHFLTAWLRDWFGKRKVSVVGVGSSEFNSLFIHLEESGLARIRLRLEGTGLRYLQHTAYTKWKWWKHSMRGLRGNGEGCALLSLWDSAMGYSHYANTNTACQMQCNAYLRREWAGYNGQQRYSKV